MRVYDYWKKGQATQDCKDVMSLHRQKIRRAKANLVWLMT